MTLHLFEFMDHPRTPRIIRETLLDVLEFCNTTFRPYYREVAERVLQTVKDRGLTTVVELGAGRAPVTREIVSRIEQQRGSDLPKSLRLIPCDLYPETAVWRELVKRSPAVQPIFESHDFTQPMTWPPGTALLLVAALHHIPRHHRVTLLKTLTSSADCVLIFEPVRRTALSMLLTSFCWFPALLTPAALIRHPGALRRILFCWLLPIVPLMFVWDGVISCLRQWTAQEWSQIPTTIPEHSMTFSCTRSIHAEVVLLSST